MATRREFLVTAGGAAAAVAVGCRSGTSGAGVATATPAPNAGAAGTSPGRLGALGVGLFTLPKSLEKDFDGTLAMLSGLGYSVSARSRWGSRCCTTITGTA